jgi:hypothetical protein
MTPYLEMLWYFVAVCSFIIVVTLAYKLHLLHTKKKRRRYLRAESLLFTQRQAAKRLSAAIKTPRATAQLSLGETSTPNLLDMMNGATSNLLSTTTPTPNLTSTKSFTNQYLSDDNEENSPARTSEVLTVAEALTTTEAMTNTESSDSFLIPKHLKPPTPPNTITDSPAIPSVVEVLKAHGSARDRLLQRRRQLLVKKKLPQRRGRKKLELSPRSIQLPRSQHQKSPHLDALRKMR